MSPAKKSNVDELMSEIDDLRDDIADIKNTIRKMGSDGADNLKDKAWDEIDNLMNELDRIKRKSKDAQKRMENGIGEHPLSTVAIAFGAGALAGMIASSARK